MNIRSQFIKDVSVRANVKLAGFSEMNPYLANALLGGSILSLLTSAPAILHSYANDEDPLKTLAEVTAYSMPIGATLGVGYTGANQLSSSIKRGLGILGNKINESIDSFGNKLSDSVVSLGNSTSDILGRLSGELRERVSPVTAEVSELFDSAASILPDVMSTMS